MTTITVSMKRGHGKPVKIYEENTATVLQELKEGWGPERMNPVYGPVALRKAHDPKDAKAVEPDEADALAELRSRAQDHVDHYEKAASTPPEYEMFTAERTDAPAKSGKGK